MELSDFNEWIINYIQVLVMLLVFAIGLPGLLFQHIVSEEVRYVTQQKLKRSRMLWIILVMVTAVLGFLIAFHPIIINGPLKVHLAKTSIIASLYVAAVLFYVCFIWYSFYEHYNKPALVKQLESEIIKNYRKEQKLNQEELKMLSYMGEMSEPGKDKDLVMESLKKIAESVVSAPGYVGDSLKESDILHFFVDVLNKFSRKKGNQENTEQAFSELDSIAQLLKAKYKDAKNLHDFHDIQNAVKEIGIIAIENSFDKIVLRIMESQDNKDEMLYEMGKIAIKSRSYFYATAALNNLESIVERQEGFNRGNISLNYLLGLMSHFWNRSHATKQRVQVFLIRVGAIFSPSLKDCINASYDFHFSICDYETADYLYDMGIQIERSVT